ncbi:unnamed protein product [Darwinula stevensoni]|uniref:Integrator complex subunit 10 n=1 Tax=Darwinula stevensoni TaxID=69355 RepID=A0A7R8XDA1_9CRUS|nr:unnamed protein product [Darwinula stevensoni]CAG0886595.1 unnamed protein product [Darwinula stevensoni]
MAQSDEEYVILLARKYKNTDFHAWKSMLKTALEAYHFEKQQRNAKDAAAYLEKLFNDFNSESALWTELNGMIDALQEREEENSGKVEPHEGNIEEGQASFLREIFQSLPEEIQEQIITVSASKTQEPMQHCQMKLVLIQKFPNAIGRHACALIDELTTSEKKQYAGTVLNIYRKITVCDVLPLVAKSPHFALPKSESMKLLRHAIEFYVVYMSSPQPLILGAGKDCSIGEPLKELVNIFEAMGKVCKKDLRKISGRNKEDLWVLLKTQREKQSGKGGSIELAYCLLMLLIICLLEYNQVIESSPDGRLVLVEAFPKGTGSEKKKGKKLDMSSPFISVRHSDKAQVSALKQSFTIALQCYQTLMNEPHLEREYHRIWRDIHGDSWPFFQSFISDYYLHIGDFQGATSHLASLKSKKHFHIDLQLASCYCALGDVLEAYKTLMALLKVLIGIPSQPYSHDPDLEHGLSSHVRHVRFVPCNRPVILHYTCTMLIYTLKERALQTGIEDDLLVGHLMVLLQYDWPEHEEYFTKALRKVQGQRQFSYPLFLKYIYEPDILADFDHLVNDPDSRVQIDFNIASNVRQVFSYF